MIIGDTFKTREGELVTIFSFSGKEAYPVVAIDSSKRFLSYTKSGCFLKDGIENARDLVEKL